MPNEIDIYKDATRVGRAQGIDFKTGGGITLTGAKDVANSQVDVTIATDNRYGTFLAARGISAENYPMMQASGGLAPTSQLAYFQLISANQGDVITGAAFHVNTAAAGTAPTGIYMGLYDSSGAQLAVTTNTAASGTWQIAQPVKFAFTSPYTMSASAAIYIAFLQNGSWGTTALQLGRIGGGGWNQAFQTGTSLPTQYTQASQATLPATATYAAGFSNQQIWVGWY